MKKAHLLKFTIFILAPLLLLVGCGGGGGDDSVDPLIIPPVGFSILSTAPSNNEIGVELTSAVSVLFTNSLNTGTLDISSFLLSSPTGAVAGTVMASGSLAIFTPSANLAPSTQYTATLTTAVTDVNGAALASAYTWTFTTKAADAPTVFAVQSTTPINTATGVEVTNAISAVFSKALNTATINSASFLLNSPTGAVAGIVTASGSLATFTPSAPLAAATQYTATITTAATDADGIALAAAYTWTFTTKAINNELLPIINVTTHITTPTTWLAGNVYVINSGIDVSSVLTIQPGVIVKFGPSGNLDVYTGGTITANGTSVAKIVFTSIKDDLQGGDTNGDGNTLPVAGNWTGIWVDASGSTFNYCEFYYGGGTSGSTLDLNASSATITNSVFAYNKGGNLTAVVGALDAGEAAAGTIIQNNVFYKNDLPLRISTKFSIDNSNMFHNPADVTKTNTYNGIFQYGGNITTGITWSETEVPFVLYWYDASIQAGGTLTLTDNVIVKSGASRGIAVYAGALVANATAGNKIVFTSIKDDSRGGDTNGDAGPSNTVAAAGDWDWIWVDASGSTFNRCEFYYGGGTGGGATLDLNASSATVTNSIFAYNKGGNLTAVVGALDAGGAAAGTIIQSNVFYGNNLPLRISTEFSIDDSNRFHNPANVAQTNKYNGIFEYGGNITAEITWSETEVPFVLYWYDASVKLGGTLTLTDNVIVKSGASRGIAVYAGALVANATAGNKIVFTSIKDDSRGGDTNGDAGPSNTVAAAGDWDWIWVDASGSTFNRCEFYYGGGTGGGATLDLNASSATIINSIFANNKGGNLAAVVGALDAGGAAAGTIIQSNVFYGNDLPLRISTNFSIDNSNTFHNPADVAQTNDYNGIFEYGGNIATTITWAETEVPFVLYWYNVSIQSGGTLTLTDNVIVKSTINRNINVYAGGSLAGLANPSVYLTSLFDDAHGGNTDGGSALPGDNKWDGVWIESNPDYWFSGPNILYTVVH